MTLAIPSQLAPRTVSRALARAEHVTGFVCIVGAMIMAIAFQIDSPDARLWPAMLALIPLTATLILLDRSRTLGLSLAYLVVGAAAVYWYTLVFVGEFPLRDLPGAFVLALPKIAVMLVGGSGTGAAVGLGWVSGGFLVATIASSAALVQTGVAVRFDFVTVAIYAVAALILILVWLDSRAGRRARPGISRATSEEIVAGIRTKEERRSTAIVHDTILSDLAAIAATPTTEIPRQTLGDIARDLESLHSVAPMELPAAADDGAAWQRSATFRAVLEGGVGGLQIECTGDVSAIGRLDPDVEGQLGLAVRQCLANVLKHSGVTEAEVAVQSSDSDVMVMVIDGGVGFTESEVAADRLGLRTSIRGRVADVGGSVQLWSTPGRGTSVLIRVPVRALNSEAERPEDRT